MTFLARYKNWWVLHHLKINNWWIYKSNITTENCYGHMLVSSSLFNNLCKSPTSEISMHNKLKEKLNLTNWQSYNWKFVYQTYQRMVETKS